jgi:ABC-type transporter Mla MlaB component
LLRISVERGKRSATFKIDGALAGPWVQELESVWRAETICGKGKYCQVDLSGVVFVDASGKKLLARMYKGGVALVAAAIETRAIIDEITRRARNHKGK